MPIDIATIISSAAISGAVSWFTASAVAGRSERGKQALEARRAVRNSVNPLLMAVTRYKSEEVGRLDRSAGEHHFEDLAFAYSVRVSANNLSWLRLFLVKRRLQVLVGSQWMDGIEHGDLTQYSQDEASRIFSRVVDQLARDRTVRPDGLIPLALESAPYSKEVDRLIKSLKRLAASR